MNRGLPLHRLRRSPSPWQGRFGRAVPIPLRGILRPSVVARDHTGHGAKRFAAGLHDGGYGLTGVMAAVVSGHYGSAATTVTRNPRPLLPIACCLLPRIPVPYCLLPVAYCLASPVP